MAVVWCRARIWSHALYLIPVPVFAGASACRIGERSGDKVMDRAIVDLDQGHKV